MRRKAKHNAEARLRHFHRRHAPAIGALVADAGVERQRVVRGHGKTAAVGFTDLCDACDGISARAELRGQGDRIADRQLMDAPKIAVRAAVVARDGDVAVPDRRFLKMSRALRQRRIVRVLIDLDVDADGGIFSVPRLPSA